MTLTVLNDTLPGESQERISNRSDLRFRASSSLCPVKMKPSSSKSVISTNFKELQDTVLHHLSKSETGSGALIKLKEHFREIIDSKRAFDRIQDFEGLFNVLKKRDELSYNKLEAFKIASNIIGDKNLREKISAFEEKFSKNEFRDLYENGKFSFSGKNRLEGIFFHRENCENDILLSEDRKNSLLMENGLNRLSEDPELSSLEGEKSERGSRRKKLSWRSFLKMICIFVLGFLIFSGIAVYASIFLRFTVTTVDDENNSQSQEEAHSSNVQSSRRSNLRDFQSYNSTRETEIGKKVLGRISDRIGNKWRDMARNLDIKESDIDAINAKYHGDLKEKAYQALKLAQAESDPRRWRSKLMYALVEARRKDLSDWVDENYQED